MHYGEFHDQFLHTSLWCVSFAHVLMVYVEESSHTSVKTVSVTSQLISSHQMPSRTLFPVWMHFYHTEACNCPAGKICSWPQYHTKLKLFFKLILHMVCILKQYLKWTLSNEVWKLVKPRTDIQYVERIDADWYWLLCSEHQRWGTWPADVYIARWNYLLWTDAVQASNS